jgi:hypothetical protein
MDKKDKIGVRWLPLERGQSLVLITLVIFALVALLALVLDGGMAYSQRRAAQNAADAGALAGANIYCSTGNVNQALDKAYDYADFNNAPVAHGTSATFSNGAIRVDAQIEYDSFFAGILGYDIMNVGATASAGCFLPCYGNVIPVVLACKPPEEDGSGNWQEGPEDDCFVYEHQDADVRYVIADSNFIECDYGDDVCEQFSQTFSPGLFAWLDLEEGGSGTGKIRAIINGDTDLTIYLPTWYRETTGNRNPIYMDLQDYIDEIFTVPIFNKRCREGDPRVKCIDKCNNDNCEDESVVPSDFYNGSGIEYFNIHRLAQFKIKCVCTGNNNCEHNGNGCSGREALAQKMRDLGANNGQINSMNTVEGVFVQGTSDDVSGRCGDGTGAGLYTIYLDN